MDGLKPNYAHTARLKANFLRITAFLNAFAVLFFAISTQTLLSQDPKKSPSHPWLAIAPGEFLRLIQVSNLEIETNDAILKARNKIGLTEYRFSIDYRFQYDILQAKIQDGKRVVKLEIQFQKPTVQFKHRIYVPSNLNTDNPWDLPILKHEMDHVAISTDPRIPAVVQRLLGGHPEWTFDFDMDLTLNSELLEAAVASRIQSIITDMESWIQFQYDRLDQVSNSGGQAITDRAKFFEGLYSLDSLGKGDSRLFPFAREVELKRGLSDTSPRKVISHYQFLK